MDAIDDAAFRFFPACFTGFGVIKPLPPGHTGRDKEDWGMGKNIRCAALIVCCCLLLCGCTASAQERYERGQMYLGFGDYATAREIFQQLGGYGDAEKYALYCAARQAMADGDWTCLLYTSTWWIMSLRTLCARMCSW